MATNPAMEAPRVGLAITAYRASSPVPLVAINMAADIEAEATMAEATMVAASMAVDIMAVDIVVAAGRVVAAAVGVGRTCG
jgi:hypothetical protein